MYRKTLLSIAITGCLAFSAHAQDAQTQATDLDTITVTVVGLSALSVVTDLAVLAGPWSP